jgi:hypothetical protein
MKRNRIFIIIPSLVIAAFSLFGYCLGVIDFKRVIASGATTDYSDNITAHALEIARIFSRLGLMLTFYIFLAVILTMLFGRILNAVVVKPTSRSNASKAARSLSRFRWPTGSIIVNFISIALAIIVSTSAMILPWSLHRNLMIASWTSRTLPDGPWKINNIRLIVIKDPTWGMQPFWVFRYKNHEGLFSDPHFIGIRKNARTGEAFPDTDRMIFGWLPQGGETQQPLSPFK